VSRVLAVCHPASDAGFGERIRQVIAQDRGDLGSPGSIALIQAVLRERYATATIVSHDGVWSGGVRRTVVLDVYRDGDPGAVDGALRWVQAVYDANAATAYRHVARILGEGAMAERVVEQAFREIRGVADNGTSIAGAGAAMETAAIRLANQARGANDAAPSGLVMVDPAPRAALAETSIRKGGARRALSGKALDCLLSRQREALELSVLEDLKVVAIADRMQTTPTEVLGHLRDALLAVSDGVPPSEETTLARLREAQRGWAALPTAHPARPARSRAVAHAWLDFQAASHSIPVDTVVLVTDVDRRFVTASRNAAAMLGRPSVVGMHIDDVTAAYARPLVSELWSLFDANGSMAGDYDCDHPRQTTIRIPFRGIWGLPIPDLQVGYLHPSGAAHWGGPPARRGMNQG